MHEMTKKTVNVTDFANVILKALPKGVLLTAKAGDKVNSMAIGWGHLGTLWEKPVFIAYVRSSRFTKGMIDESLEFTVNVPLEKADPKVIALCGTKSGRDMDKIAAAGLTTVPAEVVSAPAIKEFPLTLECRVIYREEQVRADMPSAIVDAMYTADPALHTAFYGEIVAAYVIEE